MKKSKTSTPTPSNPRVLAIDPGFDRMGVAVMEKGKDKEHVLFSTCIETHRKASQEVRLAQIGATLRDVIIEYGPETLALEKLFFNQNITTGIRVAEARGVVLYEAALAGMAVFEYAPQEVKVAVTGYGKATKSDLIRMTMRLLGLTKKPKFDDEIDAIAVGITHLASYRSI
ncbi:crossover junction endodeoxyribonuclease RuvC [Candidatus Parcubacteria bacterium]|nr:crossover junction endodeoxyribonuclease RuvC [Candidatus Parcubacteria bacterium]